MTQAQTWNQAGQSRIESYIRFTQSLYDNQTGSMSWVRFVRTHGAKCSNGVVYLGYPNIEVLSSRDFIHTHRFSSMWPGLKGKRSWPSLLPQAQFSLRQSLHFLSFFQNPDPDRASSSPFTIRAPSRRSTMSSAQIALERLILRRLVYCESCGQFHFLSTFEVY